MKKLFYFFLLFVSIRVNAQPIIINEVLPSNANHDTLFDGSSPDWVELYNPGNTAINLQGFSLRDDAKATASSFVFPDTSIAPKGYMLVYAAGDTTSNEPAVSQWETVLRNGDSWQYLLPNSQPNRQWIQKEYDASQWNIGKVGLGCGYVGDSTEIPNGTVSVYLRKNFVISNLKSVVDAVLHLDYDDGFVAYLNGIEIARRGLFDEIPLFDALATQHASTLLTGGTIESFRVKNVANILKEGENILAIEVHNSSKDLSTLNVTPFFSLGYSQIRSSSRGVSIYTPLNPTYKTTNFIAGFKIDASNDTVFLFDNKDVLLDKMILKDVPRNVSQGRIDGISFVDYWFKNPTIGTANNQAQSSNRTLQAPVFSLPAGIYHSAQKVAISAKDVDAAIYYTTDGSEPSPQNGTLYTDSVSIFSSTPLRASVSKLGCIASKVTTSSYLILKRNIDLPVISISVNPADFFDEKTGIYTLGPNAETVPPYFGANYWQDWERKIHAEIFETTGERVVSVDAGVKIGGMRSRTNPQKTLKVYMRKQYGDEKIKYRLFKDKPIDEFDNILLRNSGSDFNLSQMRDGLVSTLVRNMDIDRQAYRPAVVFINGTYWGVQNFREKISSDYIHENYGIDRESVTILEKDAKVKAGSNVEYNMLLQYVCKNSMEDSAIYAQVEKQIDIQNYINYVNTELYLVNLDWPGNNVRYWRAPNGKWRWILYDADFAFDNCFKYSIYGSNEPVSQKLLGYATTDTVHQWPNPEWSTRLLRNLVKNRTFKEQFMNSMADRLNTTFRADSVTKLIDSLQNNIRSEMVYHASRWQITYDSWFANITKIKNFAINRPQYVWQDYQDFFGVSGLFPLQISLSDNAAGVIQLNSITLNSFPWEGKYFNGIPITLTAIPKPGYRFVRWEGASTETSSKIRINADKACSIKAIFEFNSQLIPQVIINEIMYNDSKLSNSKDWIELHNKGAQTLDLSGWIVKNEIPNSSYSIPKGVKLKGDEYLAIAKDSAAFRALYKQRAIGNFSFDLAEDNDIVSLYDTNQNLIDRVSYTQNRPWPAKADGEGYSLELQPNTSGANASNWKAITMGGTPNALNAIAEPSRLISVLFTEINYKDSPNAQSGDWFEIYNATSEPVDLSQWLIQDKARNMMIIPQNTILQAHQTLVFANNLMAFSWVYPEVKNVLECKISLSSDVEQLLLFDRSETLIDSVQFSSHEPWPFLANGQGYTLTLLDVNLDNSQSSSWSIGEVFGTPGSSSFTALHDSTTSFVVTAYPNPVDKILSINAPIGTKLTLTNAWGQIVFSGISVNTTTEISVENYSSGIYSLTYSNKEYTNSIVINIL